ncbi:phenylacetic acid degradation bifunctional protein PaaZ [Oceanicella actignis]|uniref:Oxepin-CoA hydrolase / 3-oxo-5,6-dehydrosuberyl-CoA semialdehyde dehydrogenase n=1 Tax=Oceanicella actignis TaxID=1189325 RepID=A0A1M7TKC7_9RHOB|nr:phenylacetic acid degradation bifunctional protein PaaZ [Oceanicella actignis]SET68148.1 oxepin-CoA hydrolase / 3-oxo-5,6-dehydrosuberyl-CoA semialdehyde dehydrogenase [Oceanicella actignis]SHN71194.1 oxepin-CoA hydrolase / 3-oxo-5,6-dehydrosuberyl-CoA semialdehyde dehydrogenase [Oceanicella actignis]
MSVMQLRSYALGAWVAPAGARPIRTPVTGEVVAEAGSEGLDFAAMLEHARRVGGPALRKMTFHERARMLKALAQHLHERRGPLYELSLLTGATRADSLIDIDGGIGTLFVYASKGRREMPDAHVFLDGPTEQLSRSGAFMGRHVCTPLQGAAVHINAFNFPVWGMLEKLAPTLLAGVPAIVKPATQGVWLAEAAFRMIVESGILPEGAVQFIAGGVGDLLSHVGPQDVVSFTGSAATARKLRAAPAILDNATRFVAEQDSLNASILGPDAAPGTPEFDMFVREAVKEITVKAGQKCTAIRRILARAAHLDALAEALSARLAEVRVGHPALPETRMGALASAAQKADVLEAVGRIGAEARRIFGDPENFQLLGADPDKGAFLPPMLLRCDDPDGARAPHEIEAFGPVSTLMPYRDAAHAAALANRGGGSLVASVFTDDPDFARDLALASAAWHGRLYFADRGIGKEGTGHGSPLPHMVHGGPGRAGGGEELGGVRGVMHYMQRTAVQGSPRMLTAIGGEWVRGAPEIDAGVHPFARRFGELRIGETIHTPARTITLEDIERFAHFTGDTFYAHMDEEAARANPFFPGRVAHGYLLLSFAAGQFVKPEPGPVLANTGLDNLRFMKPVSPGDSIKVRLTVKRKTPRNESYGEVRWDVELTNQDDETVAAYDLLTMNAF